MRTYIAMFACALFASLVLTPLLRRLSARLGWVDVPGDTRRVHRRAVPRTGGLSILASALLSLLALSLVDNLVTQSLARERWQLVMVFAPAVFVTLVGLYDDVRGANALVKFLGLVAAGTVFYVMGGRIENLSLPVFGSIHLPMVVGYVLTIVWIVGVTNAFNLIDGIDGLAAGAALFASLVILVVSLMLGHPHVTAVALILSGALIGFLRYNFNPASIFLGDSGSLFLGFTLAAISLQGAQKASTAVAIAIPLMAFGLPVIDTGFSMVRRFLSRKPLFEGDGEHIHHMLLARGWSQRRAVFVLYGVCAALGLVSLLFVNETNRLTGLILLVVGSAVVLAVGRLRYHEVDEIKASMKRNLGERRLRAANHLRIRRASRQMFEGRGPLGAVQRRARAAGAGRVRPRVRVPGPQRRHRGHGARLRARARQPRASGRELARPDDLLVVAARGRRAGGRHRLGPLLDAAPAALDRAGELGLHQPLPRLRERRAAARHQLPLPPLPARDGARRRARPLREGVSPPRRRPARRQRRQRKLKGSGRVFPSPVRGDITVARGVSPGSAI